MLACLLARLVKREWERDYFRSSYLSIPVMWCACARVRETSVSHYFHISKCSRDAVWEFSLSWTDYHIPNFRDAERRREKRGKAFINHAAALSGQGVIIRVSLDTVFDLISERALFSIVDRPEIIRRFRQCLYYSWSCVAISIAILLMYELIHERRTLRDRII